MKPAFFEKLHYCPSSFLIVQFRERLPKLSFSCTYAKGQRQSRMKCMCLHLASSFSNSLEQNKVFTKEEGLTPTGLVWNTNVAAFLFFGTPI